MTATTATTMTAETATTLLAIQYASWLAGRIRYGNLWGEHHAPSAGELAAQPWNTASEKAMRSGLAKAERKGMVDHYTVKVRGEGGRSRRNHTGYKMALWSLVR